MQSYNPAQVLNGTYGEVWLNDDYLAEVTGLEAKASVKKSDVAMVRKLSPGKKITGVENKGTLKLNHVSSFMKQKVAESLKSGKTPVFSIKSTLADPDAIGGQMETVMLTGVTFDEVTLIDFENGKLGEESYAFEFEDFEFLNTIDV